MITRKHFFETYIRIVCTVFMLISNMIGAAESAAITVNMSLGSVGTAAELILCPIAGKTFRDTNWMYQTNPDGSANSSYPPVVATPTLLPSAPAVYGLTLPQSPWEVAQNLVVNSSDQPVPMERVLFDPASTTVSSSPVLIYVDSSYPCPHQDSYRAYLTSIGIKYTQIERDSIPDYPSLVGGLNYLSPGGVVIPLLLINGEPVVGKWRASTQARIDMLLKKHGLLP